MNSAYHRCETDGALTYLPALDPSATGVPGGARATSPVSIGSIPEFDYDPRQDGVCWICAYAEALRVGRVEPPRPRGVDDGEYALIRARARLRAPHVLAAARRAFASMEEVVAEEDEDASSSSLSTRLADLVRRTLGEVGAGVVVPGVVGSGSTPANSNGARADHVDHEVPEIPPEAIDLVAGARPGKKSRKKKFSGGGGQQSMF